MRADYVDAVKAELYREFYRNNKELFDKDRMEYWKECIPYCEKNFKRAIEKYLEEKTSREEWGKELSREVIQKESFRETTSKNLENSVEEKPHEEDPLKATTEFIKSKSLGVRLSRLFGKNKKEKIVEEDSNGEEE